MTKVYLAGPIDNCDLEQRDGWRQFLKDKYKYNIAFIDPCRRILHVSQWKEIVTLDKADISYADAILVNCWKPGWGTAQEILYAFSLGKLVVCVVPRGVIISPWIVAHSHCVTPDLDDGIAYIDTYFKNLYVTEARSVPEADK